MSTTPPPATPDQARLIIGLSCLTSLPMLGIAMMYMTRYQVASDRAPTWLAFGFALTVGVIMGLVLVRFVPVLGGTVSPLAPVRAAVAFVPVALVVAVVVGQLAHQAVAVTIGFVAGVDALLAAVLLIRSLGTLRKTTTDR